MRLDENAAKQLATHLHGKLPVIYGAEALTEAAHRWKTQLNENSKVWASYEEVSELNHNAVEGFRLPREIAERAHVMFLYHPKLNPRNILRYNGTHDALEAAGVDEGEDPWDEIFGVVAAPDSGRAVRIFHSAPRAGADPVALGRLAARKLVELWCRPLAGPSWRSGPVTSQPLAGRRVLVTRAAKQAGKLSEGLRALGADPIEVPVLEIRPPDSLAPLDSALQRLDQYDWLILTSTNAVRALMERAVLQGINFSQFPNLQGAAVGAATAAEARKSGLPVTLVPESYVAESLVSALAAQIAGKRVLLARAAIARDVIPNALREAGAAVDVVDAYQNAIPEAASGQLRQAMTQRIDAATFTSSSSATHLAEAAEKAGIAFPLPGVPAVSIGPITSQTLRELGWEPAAEASPSDIPGLIAAVVRFLGSDSISRG